MNENCIAPKQNPSSKLKAISDEFLQKREQFSVSLRNEKRKSLIAKKRARNLQNYSKTKFLAGSTDGKDWAITLSLIIAQLLKALDGKIG